MHVYVRFWRRGHFCMHFYRVYWIPLMGMSCFLVQNCARTTTVSCFFRSLLLLALANLMFFPGKGCGPGFSLCCRPSALDRTLNLSARRIFLYAFLQGFLTMRWLLNAFLQGLLKSAYGNVAFSRANMYLHYKSFMFFRSLLLAVHEVADSSWGELMCAC